MKEILLSFKPCWADKIMSGDKIYEYRKRFCDEPVMAYMYVSNPVKAVTGVVLLGSKQYLKDVKLKYSFDKEVSDRIDDSMKRNMVMMPIEKVYFTNAISLEELRKNVKGFAAPQIYYILDNNMQLKNYIKEKIKFLPGEFDNFAQFKDINKICEKF